MYFITNELLSEIASQTNLYSKQKNVNSRFVTNNVEIRKFIGILIFMSVYRYPSVRSYWGQHGFQPIIDAMQQKTFESICQHLHFADSSNMVQDRSHPDYDMLYKVRPLLNHFNTRFGSVPKLQRLCVDEQMCSTKMRKNNIRQYMPNKSHKWGFKFFVLCDSTGFSYSFELYTGNIHSNTRNLQEQVDKIFALICLRQVLAIMLVLQINQILAHQRMLLFGCARMYRLMPTTSYIWIISTHPCH